MSLAIVLTLAAAAYRLLPHPYNIAPLGAIALMGGIWLGRRYALWVPLVALAATDLVLNARMGYPILYWPRAFDYGAFALIGAAGLWARPQGRWTKFSLAVITPFVFFLISNLGVWLFGLSLSNEMYPRTLAGLTACYVAGLPFLRGTLIGDWGFVIAFAGAAALATHRQTKSVPATT
jgi:hypothetical protein